MKVYMSTDMGERRQAMDLLARINQYTWQLETQAVAEAHAILAETEPNVASAHLTLTDHRTGSVPLATTALVMALRTFLAD